MSDFTPDEIETAVQALVQSVITTPNDSLGNRSTGVTFSGVQVATAGIFILYPLAPFYCVYLGAKRLLEAIQAETALLGQIEESLQSLNRLVLPVTDLSPLANAQAALQALSSAVSAKTPVDITTTAQYQRYTSNVKAFLTGPASAVKQNGAIVPTPQEAVAALPGYMTQLLKAHTATVQSAQYLANAMADYNSVNLPTLVAEGVINNASTVLASDTAALNALSPTARLAALRTPVLNLLTAQSVIAAFGSYSGPSALYSIKGTGYPYWDITHPATPAELEATLGMPFVISPGVNDTLVFTLDGGAKVVTTKLGGSLFATMSGVTVEAAPQEGGVVDGYLIGNGVHPTDITSGQTCPDNNFLHLQVSSPNFATVDIPATLTICNDGPTITRRTAQNICDDINAAIGATSIAGSLIAQPFFYPTAHFIGTLNITPGIGSSATFDLPVIGAGSLTPVLVGDILIVASGPNAGYWSVTAVNSSSEIVASKDVGFPSAQLGASVTIGPKDRGVQLIFQGPTSVSDQMTLTILGDTTVATNTANTLGFTPGTYVTCAPSTISDIITAISQQQTTVGVTSVVDPLYSSFSITTDPTNPFHVIASKILTSGALAFALGTIMLSGTSGLLAAGVAVGDTIVLRGQDNTVWTVASVTDTSLTATGGGSATPTGSVTFEVGPTLVVAQWQTLQISQAPNKGNFVVSGVGVSPIDIILRQRNPIPHYADPATLQAITGTAILGIEYLEFSSPTTTTSSAVAVSGTGVAVFWSPAPAAATGSTPYFFLPTPTAGGVPSSGDILELFTVNYANPSSEYVVNTVDQGINGFILGLATNIDDVPTTWSFGQIPVPFAALRHGHVADYVDFQIALTNWLSLPPQQITTFFQNLNRLINPLIANSNPTPAQINTALQQIYALAVLLDIEDATAQSQPPSNALESILDNYRVDDVPQIDTLVSTFKAQGGDRAVDILLSGQFSMFFGLTQAGSSYAGQMQASTKAVAMNDLPVRKTNRIAAVQQTNLGTAQSPDFEYDTSDSEAMPTPDAPNDFAKTTGSTA